ncbi:MAG: cyclic nucleotide-binding domain-containing protein [Ketobacter sp.]|nr:cyclic nucleotide-binding domain-containing protein [Ketobacter sp.]
MMRNWLRPKNPAAPEKLQPTNSNRQSKHLIELKEVIKVYETPAGPFTALKGVNLQVDKGEFVAVIGKSGSGKSTLINTITGIDRPTVGQVLIGGTPIHTLNENQIAVWRGRNLGVIFQFFQLLPTLTLIENVMLPMEFCRLYTPAERKDRAMHLLELVEMAEQADKLPSAVSGGQQQRVAIARALANDPDVLVADEPTGSLDSKTADAIFELFENLVDQGKTILMVTHDRDLAGRVKRVVLIADGEIVDEYISKALDTLDKQQLVQISSKLEPVTYGPNAVIFRKGDSADKFYIIIKGQVEVVLEPSNGPEIVSATLSNGQYFGEIGLLQNSTRTATVRVGGESEAILMALDRDTFSNLMTNSDLTQDAIAGLMRQRITAGHLMSILPDLNDEEWQEVEANFEVMQYKPEQIIIRRGDEADKFYLITEGEVEILQADESTVITRLGSGQYFGETGLLRDNKRTATVRAAANGVEVMAISREAFTRLMAESKMSKEDIVLLGMRRRLTSKMAEFGLPSLHRRRRHITGVWDALEDSGD